MICPDEEDADTFQIAVRETYGLFSSLIITVVNKCPH